MDKTGAVAGLIQAIKAPFKLKWIYDDCNKRKQQLCLRQKGEVKTSQNKRIKDQTTLCGCKYLSSCVRQTVTVATLHHINYLQSFLHVLKEVKQVKDAQFQLLLLENSASGLITGTRSVTMFAAQSLREVWPACGYRDGEITQHLQNIEHSCCKATLLKGKLVEYAVW